MRRHLQDGRFSEDMALGLPLRVGTALLLPTAAGVLTTDEARRRGEIAVGPFPGLGDGGVPRVLLQQGDRTLYLGDDTAIGAHQGQIKGRSGIRRSRDALSVAEQRALTNAL